MDTAGVLMQRQIPVPSLSACSPPQNLRRGPHWLHARAGDCRSETLPRVRHLLRLSYLRRPPARPMRSTTHRKSESRELKVGAIVLAPGYELFDARLKKDLGYGRFPNVLTALEFERILSASGPYSGHVLRPFDRQEPKRIAFLQCVGSRDVDHDYCSSVCCMYATKEAIIAKEHLGEGLQCDIFFMDLRAFGKGFEQYYRPGARARRAVHPFSRA